MSILIKTLAAVAAGIVFAASSVAQSAREVRGPSPYNSIENEPPPKLVVDPALPVPLARGIVQIQYRVENVRIVPVFGAGALNVSPRVGHLHVYSYLARRNESRAPFERSHFHVSDEDIGIHCPGLAVAQPAAGPSSGVLRKSEAPAEPASVLNPSNEGSSERSVRTALPEERDMKARQIVIGIAASVLIAGSSAAFAQSSGGRQPIRQQMTCGDFLRLDDLAKPEAVYWVATRGLKRNGGVPIDPDATDEMVPAIVERCKGAPTAPLVQHVSAETEKLRGKL